MELRGLAPGLHTGSLPMPADPTQVLTRPVTFRNAAPGLQVLISTWT